MVLIEGVGDEVIQFVAVVIWVVVAGLAWWSTNARPDRYRTVLVLRSRNFHPVTVSIRSGSHSAATNSSNSIATATQSRSTEIATTSSSAVAEDTGRSSARAFRFQEMDSIVDADVAMMNHNRLHFYRRMDSSGNSARDAESTSDESEMQDDIEPPSSAQMREMDSIVNAMEAGASGDPFDNSLEVESPEPVVQAKPSAAGDSAAAAGSEQARILIKLKYLNDTLKEVDGSLDELLKDFKWRHFTDELSARCRVRLIYNGRVLEEARTLRACGLRDQAVVHALVHPPRPHMQASEDEAAGSAEAAATNNAAGGGWDLENILMTLVSVALTVVWFFRCEYSSMFTASASVALFGLTVFYSVAIFGLYLSDTFHFADHRPAPPPPLQ